MKQKLMWLFKRGTVRGRLLLLSLGLLIIVLPFVLDVFWVLMLTEFAILALFALAYNLILGLTGMFSFGHGGLFGVGVYVVGVAVIKGEVPLPYALIAAPFVTGIVALAAGWFCLRLTGIYFAILTLAFGQLIWAFIWKMRGVTGGSDGLAGLAVPSCIASPVNQYFFIFIIVAIGIAMIWMITNSSFGFTLKAIRENPQRAQSVGVNVKRYQLMAFILSGCFTGLAGGLFAIFVRGAFVEFASVARGFQPVYACLIGGMSTFAGPIVGAGVLLFLDSFVSRFTEYWPLVAGIILILWVLFLPEGLLGYGQSLVHKWTHKGDDNQHSGGKSTTMVPAGLLWAKRWFEERK
jgi:branched-chain amino acid transport system permease protein